ncbi:hypothetical protein Misp01_75950 [Microtetraspora sp. NBRC 13810]|uniref:hypothetical protein n=1 Tax=Microtetraspora sp. NBRC 13810 TaxID=3030990 RepID=UPI0024A250B7|nr:hypothetical protein [Microtetraspora sp. NBRC 13810]GLW12467.1 hypothetical protein Misp01_75950 [Microtetraspora sp. NBRC 13810]
MPQMLDPTPSRPFRLSLNTDGRSHPRENALSVLTVLLGVVAFFTAFVESAHVVASWAGLAGFLIGLYSQYVSETTPQRSLNVVGLVGAFVGVALGIFHGGFLP